MIIDLTGLDDGLDSKRDGTHSCQAEVESYLKTIAILQTEILDLKSELEHTQVDLKYTKEKLQREQTQTTSQIQPCGLHSKRPRSPSVEYVDPQVLKKIKGKIKEEIGVKLEFTPTKPKLEVDISSNTRTENMNPVPTVDFEFQPPVALAIQPPPSTMPVSRASLQLRYLGQSQTLIQKIKQLHNPSSTNLLGQHRQLIFPDAAHNPHLPLTPGEGGFIFASRKDVQGCSFSLFVRCIKSKAAVWTYFGEYQTEKCATMSTKYFCSLSDKVKHAWAKSIFVAKSKPAEEYIAMRGRITLRKMNKVMPSSDKINALVQKEMSAPKGTQPKVEQSDILEAMVRGEEHLDIVRLTCVSYDHVFAEDIQDTINVAKNGGTIQTFIHPHWQNATISKKSKNFKVASRKPETRATHSRGSAKEQHPEDFDDNNDQGFTDDRNGSREPSSTSDRQLRPRKSTQHVWLVAEQCGSDYESEEEIHSEYDFNDG